jgi:hypothetical protein
MINIDVSISKQCPLNFFSIYQDPFLEDVEELYKVSTPGSNKKEKRKQKADRKKENRSRKSGQTVLKLA